MLREWDESIVHLCVQTERALRPEAYERCIVPRVEEEQRTIAIRCIQRAHIIHATMETLLSCISNPFIRNQPDTQYFLQEMDCHIAEYLRILRAKRPRHSPTLRAVATIVGRTHGEVMDRLHLFRHEIWLNDDLYPQLRQTSLAPALSEEEARACFQSFVEDEISLTNTQRKSIA